MIIAIVIVMIGIFFFLGGGVASASNPHCVTCSFPGRPQGEGLFDVLFFKGKGLLARRAPLHDWWLRFRDKGNSPNPKTRDVQGVL